MKPTLRIQDSEGNFQPATLFESTVFEKSYSITDLQNTRLNQIKLTTLTIPYGCNADILRDLSKTVIEINVSGYPERFNVILKNRKKGDKIQLEIVSDRDDLLDQMKGILIRDLIDPEQVPQSLAELQTLWPNTLYDGSKQAYYANHFDKNNTWFKDVGYGYWESAARPLLYVKPLLEKGFCQLGLKLNAPLYDSEYGRKQVVSALNERFYEEEIEPNLTEYLRFDDFFNHNTSAPLPAIYRFNELIVDEAVQYNPVTGQYTFANDGTYYLRFKFSKTTDAGSAANFRIGFTSVFGYPNEVIVFDQAQQEFIFIRRFAAGDTFTVAFEDPLNNPSIITDGEMEVVPFLLDIPLQNHISQTTSLYDIFVGERDFYGLKMIVGAGEVSLFHDIGDGTFSEEAEPIEPYWSGCEKLEKIVCNSIEHVANNNINESQQFKFQNDSVFFSDELEQGREIIFPDSQEGVTEYLNSTYLQTYIDKPNVGIYGYFISDGTPNDFGAPYRGGIHRLMVYQYGIQNNLDGSGINTWEIRETESSPTSLIAAPNVFPVMPDIYISSPSGTAPYDYGEENVVYGSGYRTKHLFEVFHEDLFLSIQKEVVKLQQEGKDCSFNGINTRALQLVRVDGILQKYRLSSAKRTIGGSITNYNLIPYSPVKHCEPCSVGIWIKRNYSTSGIPILISFWPRGEGIEVLEHWVLDKSTGSYTQSILFNQVDYAVGVPTHFTHFWKIRKCLNLGKADNIVWLSFDVEL